MSHYPTSCKSIYVTNHARAVNNAGPAQAKKYGYVFINVDCPNNLGKRSAGRDRDPPMRGLAKLRIKMRADNFERMTAPECIPDHPWKRNKAERLSNVSRISGVNQHTLDDTPVAIQCSA
jgi:hypothetical protein